MVKARRIYRRVVTSNGYLGSEQRALFQLLDRRMILYPLVFVLCWGPGFFPRPDWCLDRKVAAADLTAFLCLCCFPAAGLAFLRVAKPTAGHGVLGAVLYISQVSWGLTCSFVFGY